MPRAFIEVLPQKKLFPPRVREARFLLPWARGAKSLFRGKTSMNEPGINPPHHLLKGAFFLELFQGGLFYPALDASAYVLFVFPNFKWAF